MSPVPWPERLSALGLLFSGGTLLVNLACFRRPRGPVPGSPPAVSVLVPARNEGRNIERCVRSLLAQRYPRVELIVLDDHSEDDTGSILATIQAEVGADRLRLLRGEPLPQGWAGKNWACHQLALAANSHSDFLLFTDADTAHAPDALVRAVGEATRARLHLLSLMPEQEVGSWAELAAVPLLPLQILGFLPLPAMERLPHEALAAANGQYMLFRRTTYQEIGGHAARRDEISEDVSLARLVKARGGRLRLANGAGLVRCRMYRSAGEVEAGFRRSFASGFRIDGRVAAGIVLVNFLTYLLPFLRAPWVPAARRIVVLVVALRLLLGWRSRTPLRSALFHPLGISLLLRAQFGAAYDAFVGGEASWKGRRYGLARPDPSHPPRRIL